MNVLNKLSGDTRSVWIQNMYSVLSWAWAEKALGGKPMIARGK